MRDMDVEQGGGSKDAAHPRSGKRPINEDTRPRKARSRGTGSTESLNSLFSIHHHPREGGDPYSEKALSDRQDAESGCRRRDSEGISEITSTTARSRGTGMCPGDAVPQGAKPITFLFLDCLAFARNDGIERHGPRGAPTPETPCSKS